MSRIALALLALLAVQGLVSLTAKRSLLWEVWSRRPHALRSDNPVAPPPAGGSAADAARGPYAAHPDARVGRVLRASAELTLDGITLRSDGLGLRARPGPPAAPEALRVAVLGGSAVFGRRLSDADTLAARLEALLSQAQGVGANAAPVECRTVALPGWNERNSIHFLLDHLDLLDPQLVVFVAEPGQLYDTESVDEQGEPCWLPDPASADRWLPLTRPLVDGFMEHAARVLAERGEPPRTGVEALHADLTRESQRRYDENAALLVELGGHLRARGSALLVAHYEDGPYALNLGSRLAASGSAIDLFSRVPGEPSGAPEPESDAQAADAMAHWIAAECLHRGWVPGLAREAAASEAATLLAQVPAALAARRAAPRSAQERLDAAAEARAVVARELLPEIDVPTLVGVAQILGGVRADGSIGTHALFVLARGGPRLQVRLAPLPGRPDLYPLKVTVEIDGQTVGRLSVAARERAERFIPLPAGVVGPAFEVRLIPERSVVLTGSGAEGLAAFRLLRLACVPE